MSAFKSYLGDSVYADFDGWQVKLTTESGGLPDNVIYLEPAVVEAFLQYIERLKKE